MEEFNNIIKTLNRSPLFNLSLSSKELFHSNFLAWLFDTYSEEALLILSELIDDKMSSFFIKKIMREKKQRDLVIIFKDASNNEKILAIENKVKSLPYKEQLENYSDPKSNNTYNVLLSIYKPDFVENNLFLINGVQWKFISYGDLMQSLLKIKDKIYSKNQYHGEILNDYILFVSAFNELFYLYLSECKENHFDIYGTSDILNFCEELRIGDLLKKFKYNYIVSNMYKCLNVTTSNKIYLSNKWKEGKEGDIFANSDMMRSEGLADVKYVIFNNEKTYVVLGIQIQSNQFRLFIESNIKNIETIALELYKNKLWFEFNHELLNCETTKEYPKSVNSFNRFGDSFRYRHLKMDHLSLNNLNEIVKDYVLIINSSLSQLKDLVIRNI